MAIPVLMRCPLCGSEQVRTPVWVNVPEETRLYTGQQERLPEICTTVPQDPDAYAGLCRGELEVILQGQATDLLPGDFIVDLETIGRGKGHARISSLSEIRSIERESEKKHRNGEGQIIAWRDLSMNRNNRERNTFEGSSYQTGKSRLPPRRTTQSGLPIHVSATSDKS
jgi:hypothetical protein